MGSILEGLVLAGSVRAGSLRTGSVLTDSTPLDPLCTTGSVIKRLTKGCLFLDICRLLRTRSPNRDRARSLHTCKLGLVGPGGVTNPVLLSSFIWLGNVNPMQAISVLSCTAFLSLFKSNSIFFSLCFSSNKDSSAVRDALFVAAFSFAFQLLSSDVHDDLVRVVLWESTSLTESSGVTSGELLCVYLCMFDSMKRLILSFIVMNRDSVSQK